MPCYLIGATLVTTPVRMSRDHSCRASVKRWTVQSLVGSGMVASKLVVIERVEVIVD